MTDDEYLDRLQRYDALQLLEARADRNDAAVHFLRNLPDNLTLVDLARQGYVTAETIIPGWDEAMSNWVEDEREDLRSLLHKASIDAHVTRGYGLAEGGPPLSVFRQMRAEDFAEHPTWNNITKFDLSRKEFILLHRMLTVPPVAAKQ